MGRYYGETSGIPQAASLTTVTTPMPKTKPSTTNNDERPTRAQFARLQGKGITLTDAAAKYGLLRARIAYWAKHPEYLKRLGTDRPAQYDEADPAFLAAVVRYREAHGIINTDLLNEDGSPRFELVAQYMADRRRKQKQQQTAPPKPAPRRRASTARRTFIKKRRPAK